MVLNPDALVQGGLTLLYDIAIFVAVVIAGISAGYIVGYLVAAIIKRILQIREVKEQIAGSEIVSLAFWSKVLNGVGVYIKWLFISIGLRVSTQLAIQTGWGNTSMFGIFFEYARGFQDLMVDLGVLLMFTVVGVVVGAVVYKIIKSALDSVRVEERMAKHGLQDALGGLQLTKVVAGIFMIYVVLVLMGSGIDIVAERSGAGFNEVRLVVMFRELVRLYPDFVLGGFIIIGGAIIGDFMQDRIKQSKTSLASESVGFLVQGMVLFFAIVLALPHFQIKENVDILTDSFKIIVAGISIGLAIAMGLGLKDTFGKWGKKVGKKL